MPNAFTNFEGPMIRFACAAPLLALLLCGCSFIEREPYRTTAYFEIIPTKAEMLPGTSVSSLSVVSSIQFSDRMLFKVGPDRLQFDEYNRWVSSPETMFKRYLEIAMAPSATAKSSAQIKILRFGLDKLAMTANCEILLTVYKSEVPRDSVHLIASVPVKGENAADFVEAMHSAIAEVAAKIAAEIKKCNG